MRNLFLLSFLFSALHLSAANAALPFPQAGSDLPADPAAHFFTPPNGVTTEELSVLANTYLAPGLAYPVKVTPASPPANTPAPASKN